MANLKTFSGFPIQNLSSDPVPYAQALADNPYVGTWSSGGNMNTARAYMQRGSVGTQTAGLGFGGTPPTTGATEEYNGSSWAESGDLSVTRFDLAGLGTQTAAMAAGGEGAPGSPDMSSSVELYGGTSWTSGTAMPSIRRTAGGMGTTTAALIAGGNLSASGTTTNDTIEWDGSSWTEGGNMNQARRYFASYGTQTAAQIAGGTNPPNTALVEEYNGSSWTEISDLNTATSSLAGTGSITSALVFGGNSPGVTGKTESWDNTSWTEVNDLSTARTLLSSSGASNVSALAFGGLTPSATNATEEWSFSGLPPSTPAAGYSDAIVGQIYYNTSSGSFKAVKDGGAPIGTWAAGGTVNTARGLATQTGASNSSAILMGGSTPGVVYEDVVEQYNGSAWSEIAEFNTGRNGAGSLGSVTAALITGGTVALNTETTATETWNGSSWTEVSELNTAGREMFVSCSGTTTAGLASPRAPGGGTLVESWDGSSWSEIAETSSNVSMRGASGNAPATSTMLFGGGYPRTTNTEIYDGSSWTEVSNMNNVRADCGGGGDSILDSIAFGGRNPSGPTSFTEAWNGSTWSEVADQGVASRFYFAGSGTGSSALKTTGYTASPGANSNATEEWTAADFTINPVTTS